MRNRSPAARRLRLTSSSGHDTRREGIGFTLVEMLVTVAAFSLVAVGLAVIFEGVGRTVTAGRRVSDLTSTAAAIERQMRADFAALSRKGFLVIAHAHANDGQPLPAFPQQPPARQRARRCDEIVFFASGEFRSQRDPLAPGFTPESREARLYYGHGVRLVPDRSSPTTTYMRPDIDDDNLDPMIGLGEQIGGNPNRYPSQWMLLRHATVLAGPGATLRSAPSQTFSDPNGLRAFARDSDIQVALQPAVSSLFMAAAGLEPCAGVPTTVRSESQFTLNGNVRPRFASGIVDVATTDLAEVRAWIVIGSRLGNPVYNDNGTFNDSSDDYWEIDYNVPARLANCAGLPRFNGMLFNPPRGGGVFLTPPAPAPVQQAWMLDAFPAPSQDRVVRTVPVMPVPPVYPVMVTSVAVPDSERTRLRYEPEPPDYFGAMAAAGRPEVAQMRLADQRALTASNFLPRCSEFIVEWSFGDVFFDPGNTNDPRTGQLIWHGKRREVSVTGRANPVRVADLYLENTTWGGLDEVSVPYRLREPYTDPITGETKTFLEHPVARALIHGDAPQSPNVGRVEYSFFGYVDPTFNPADPAPGIRGLAAVDQTIPWAWPELIRVTLTLADPTDASIEQTFQFVFRVPGESSQ